MRCATQADGLVNVMWVASMADVESDLLFENRRGQESVELPLAPSPKLHLPGTREPV